MNHAWGECEVTGVVGAEGQSGRVAAEEKLLARQWWPDRCHMEFTPTDVTTHDPPRFLKQRIATCLMEARAASAQHPVP
jgi:hypothetical protein